MKHVQNLNFNDPVVASNGDLVTLGSLTYANFDAKQIPMSDIIVGEKFTLSSAYTTHFSIVGNLLLGQLSVQNSDSDIAIGDVVVELPVIFKYRDVFVNTRSATFRIRTTVNGNSITADTTISASSTSRTFNIIAIIENSAPSGQATSFSAKMNAPAIETLLENDVVKTDLENIIEKEIIGNVSKTDLRSDE